MSETQTPPEGFTYPEDTPAAQALRQAFDDPTLQNIEAAIKAAIHIGSCAICAGRLSLIRGKHPGEEDRKVCPTCLAERMDQIRDIAHPDYGRAFTAKSIDLKQIT